MATKRKPAKAEAVDPKLAEFIRVWKLLTEDEKRVIAYKMVMAIALQRQPAQQGPSPN